MIKDSSGKSYGYRKLCICSGSVPKLVHIDNPKIIGLRDTDSAVNLKTILSSSKRICVLGNGGIATELIYELKNIDVIWVIRDKYIASAFVDSGAAEFLMNCTDGDRNPERPVAKSLRYTTTHVTSDSNVPGCSLGPNWHTNLELTGALEKKNVTIEYETFIKAVSETKPENYEFSDNWPIYVTLNNGKIFGCDFIVSATGVSPAVPDVKVVTVVMFSKLILESIFHTLSDDLGRSTIPGWERRRNFGRSNNAVIRPGCLCCRRCLHSKLGCCLPLVSGKF